MASTSFIKTPLLFNAVQIQKEVALFADKQVSDKVHPLGWEAIAIREDYLNKGAYLSYVMQFFPKEKVAVEIERSTKRGAPTEDLQKRAKELFSVYIPLVTEDSYGANADSSQGMKPGQCWFLSPLSSPSEQVLPMLHLRIDLRPSAWTEQFMELHTRYTSYPAKIAPLSPISSEAPSKDLFHKVFGLFSGKVGVNS